MKKNMITRLIALLLVLCSVLGLMPSVALFEANAADAVATETASLINELKTGYNNLTIPKNQEVYNYTTLDGVFFLGHGKDRIIDFSRGNVSHKDRLTAKTNEDKAGVNYSHMWSVPITQTNGTSINTINGAAIKTLDFAVEIKSYTGTITYNKTQSFTDDNGKTKKGWVNYVTHEYNRSNAWCGTSTYYGEYLGIYGVPTSSDPKYSIKSLHPNRASAPYLACDNDDGELRLSGSAYPFFFKVNDTKASVKIYKVDPTGGNFYTYWLGVDLITTDSNNYCYTAHTMSQIVREDRNKSTNAKYANCKAKKFNFSGYNIYQVNPVPLELYNVLLKAKPYVTGGNSNDAYPAENYLSFLKFVQSAMTLYNNKKNSWSTDKNNADRIICDDKAKDLRSYMALLDIESKSNSYMDIPMEVLDFRADGFLFEHCGGTSPYTLGSGIPSFSSNAPIPGYAGTGTNGGSFRGDLIEKKLVNGQIVYREETVRYVAEALYCQYLTLSDPGVTKTKSSYDAHWNTAFMQKVDPSGLAGNKRSSSAAVNPYPLGACGYDYEANYDATIAKTDTRSPGGILRFDQVENCFDLAYYMLINMWRETAKDDYVDTTLKLPYNLKINELSTMRMLKDSQGYYVFSSDKENGRCVDSGLIFNHNLTTSAGSSLPTLNAASDLGFESPSMLGNNSTGANENNSAMYGRRNYHVMYHVRSTFIYYEDKNLEFTFSGDDDVYFFINDTLVCDIGGMHSQTERGVKLNGPEVQDLNLKDGDICTFDMFLVERQTSQINLNLRTNIEMMPVGIATDKVQYQYTQPGVIGEEIREGGVVADNTKVGYGFKLLNRCDYGAVDLTFTDDNLNVQLTADTSFSLGGKANAEDLILIYRTYDPHNNVIYSGEPVAQSYDIFKSMLTAAVEDMSTIVPMDEGAYMLTGLTEAQIKELLRIGLPASVQISVYGFCQTVSSSVGGYTNVVNTTCRPIANRQADGSFEYEAPLSGFATRNLNVQTLNTVTAEPLQIVIDYGKPVVFTEAEVLKCVTYDPMDVSISLKGFLKTGKHGAIVFRDPAELFLCEENSELSTDNGVYDKILDTVRFTPVGMLEEIDRIYAMVRVDDVYLGGGWYLTVAIEIIPATIMYYEAEKLEEDGELTFTEKFVEEVTGAPSETEPEENPDEGGTTETEPEENPDEGGTTETEPEENPDEGGTTETEPEEDPDEGGSMEDDGIRFNHSIGRLTDNGDVEHSVGNYSPIEDKNVLFFDFNTYADNSNPYSENSAYGGVNFGNVANWWSPSYGTINSMSDGVIKFTTTNTDGNPWGYIATGKAGSPVTNANKAQFPLQYRPTEEDWLEIRLKIEKTGAQTLTNTHLRVEFFPLSGDTNLTRTAVTTKNFPVSNINNGYFVLKFPIATTMDNHDSPCGIPYKELSIVRRINFLIRGLEPRVAFTTYIDYIYIGPEETCPSNMGGNSLYFGFDNTDADRYRYTDPIYGSNFNFDTAAGWSGTSGRTPSVQVIDGVLTSTVGAAGSYSTNSPYFQTAIYGGSQLTLDYPATGAEVARVKLKLKDLTTDLNVDPEKIEINNYPEYAVARLGFVLDNDASYETSACWVDWPLSDEQLAGGDFITLTADLRELLAERGAKRIAAVRLTIVNAASAPGTTGYVYVDEIYVGPEQSQDSDVYVAPTETFIPAAPVNDTSVPTYDSSILYFGFGNSDTDTIRYSTNPVYKGNNFDTAAKWQGTGGRTVSVSNGALHLSGSSGGNSYVVFNTGANTSDFDHLSYIPHRDDWFEIRIKINDLTALADTNKISFDIEMYKDSTQLYKINYGASFAAEGGVQSNRYYTISFKLPDKSGSWANTIPYGSVGTAKRFAFNPVGLKTNKTYSCSIDYIYVGPEEKLPSKSNNTDCLYFGFDNDRDAHYEYGSTNYGGVNYDLSTNWRAGRTTKQEVKNGALVFTSNTAQWDNAKNEWKEGSPWFETQKSGSTYSQTLYYNPAKAEVARIRVKFTGLEVVDNKSPVTLQILFGTDSSKLEPADIWLSRNIDSAHVATDGKWFTYTVDVKSALSGVSYVSGIRIRFLNVHSPAGTSGTISLDYVYVGPALDGAPEEYHSDADCTYGYDSTYALDSMYSDNETLYTEGWGVPVINSDGSVNYDGTKQYTEMGFSFTGTGFDLISRTGVQQGMIRVSVYKAEEWLEDNRVKTISVNNKGSLELYQIPVVSVQGLEHGTYHVKIWVNAAVTADSLPQIPGLDFSALLRGNEFYLDAIRIYDPIDVSGNNLTEDQTLALTMYGVDGEADPYIQEIRDKLLPKATFDTLNGTTPGTVFLDVNSIAVDPEAGNVGTNGSTDYTTASVQTYTDMGPKNEVYLAPGQAVAFRLAVDSALPIAGLDIGAKVIASGGSGKLAVGFVEGTDSVVAKKTWSVGSATTQYYAVDTSSIKYLTSGSDREVYLVIYNEGTGTGDKSVISVTGVKVAYEAAGVQTMSLMRSATEAAPVRFLVDANTPKAVETFVQTSWETPKDEEPEVPTPPGESEPADPGTENVAQEIKIYHSLNLASDISLNYLVAKSQLEGYENLTMVCTVPVYDGNDLIGTEEICLEAEDKDANYYYFTLTGLTAVNMNDIVSAVLTMTKDGEKYRSNTDEYSVAHYAYGQLAKENIPQELKTLCAELLRYGGAAQIYKEYRTDNLADAAMTEEQRALLTDPDGVAFDSHNRVLNTVEGTDISWAGKSLLLDSKVAIRYVLDLSKYTGELSDLYLVLTYTDIKGEEKTVTLENPVLYNEKLSYYCLDFDGLLAAELRQPIHATVYCGDAPATGTLEYSASTYGNNKTGTLLELCRALMAYSDSAKSYFAG